MTNPTIVCPNCGGESFGITVTQVGFGPVEEYDGERDIEVHRMGEVLDADEEVFCRECDLYWRPEELETREEYEQ